MMGPLIGGITIFGVEEASRMRFTAYEEWRMVTFSHFFEHIDFLSIFQWLVGSFIRISLAVVMILDLLSMPKGKKQTAVLFIIFLLAVVISQIPISDHTFMLLLMGILLPGSICVMVGFTLLLLVVSWINPRWEHETQ